MNNVYNKIKEINYEGFIITIISGDNIGEKILLDKNNNLIWGREDSFLYKNINSILQSSKQEITIENNRIFIDKITGDKKIVICGGGYVSMSLIPILKMIGYYVTVIEDRLLFANKCKKQGANNVICGEFSDILNKIEGNNTDFVVVTRGHRFDKECLGEILKKDFAYCGMMGSRSRVKLMKSILASMGYGDEKINSIHMPIGIDINAQTPEEIAISICSEIIKNKNQPNNILQNIKEIVDEINIKKEKIVLATIISKKGSVPRKIGTKMLIKINGDTVNTIGGGCMEAEVITQSRYMISNNETKARIIEIDMTNQEAQDDGMICGGRMEVLLELI